MGRKPSPNKALIEELQSRFRDLTKALISGELNPREYADRKKDLTKRITELRYGKAKMQ